jgi:hypothetical protein
MQPITLAVQNAMDPRDIGVATSSATFFRQMGATAGTAVFLSLLFSTVGEKIQDAYAAAARTPQFQQALADPAVAANPANQPILSAVHGGGAVGSSALNDTSFLSRVTPVLARPFKVGFSDSMDMIFLVAAAILVLAFLLLVFLPQIPLRTQSALSAREGAPDGRSPGDLSPAGPSSAELAAAGPSGDGPPTATVAGPAPPPDDREPVGVPTGPPAVRDSAGAGSVGAGSARAGGLGPLEVRDVSGAEHAGHRPETLADVAPVRMPLSNEAIVTGRVDGPGGGPVSGATVTVTDFGGAQLARAVTGLDGTYRLVVPTGGTFLFICAAEHHQPAASLITITGGELHRDVSLSGAGQLEGAVADQNGRPIPGAVLTLIDARGEVVASAAAGPDGGYLLTGLYPSEYTLTATAEGTRPAARSVVLEGTGSGRVDLVLMTNGTLAGLIRAATSGQPVADASVMAIDQFGAVVGATVTGTDGRYEFGDLAPSVYTVTASGYAPVASRVELTGDRIDHDIVLGAPANGHRPGVHAAMAPAEASASAPGDGPSSDSPTDSSSTGSGSPTDSSSTGSDSTSERGAARSNTTDSGAARSNPTDGGAADASASDSGAPGSDTPGVGAAGGDATADGPAGSVPAPRTGASAAPADGTAVNGHDAATDALSSADRDGGTR